MAFVTDYETTIYTAFSSPSTFEYVFKHYLTVAKNFTVLSRSTSFFTPLVPLACCNSIYGLG